MNVNALLCQCLAGCIVTGTIAPRCEAEHSNKSIALTGAIPAISASHNSEEIAPRSLAGLPLQMAQATPLTGNWKLVNMTAADSPMPMLLTVEQTADFADGRIAGAGGCNRFRGGYETEGNRLKIASLASTFMACESDVMRQEFTYLAALQGAQQYEVTPEGLTIAYRTEAGAGVLRFVAQTTGESVGESMGGSVRESVRESVGESSNESVSESPSQPVRGLW